MKVVIMSSLCNLAQLGINATQTLQWNCSEQDRPQGGLSGTKPVLQINGDCSSQEALKHVHQQPCPHHGTFVQQTRN